MKTFNDQIEFDKTTNEEYDDSIYDVDQAMSEVFEEPVDEKKAIEQIEEIEKTVKTEELVEKIVELEEEPIVIAIGEKTFERMVKQHEQAKAKFKKTSDATNFQTIISITSEGLALNFTWDVPKQYKTQDIIL